jgi:predicted DNA-binding antitoxin AbrB/MazE fold protein
MTSTVHAIYDNGVLRLTEPLFLPDQTPVTVTIETNFPESDRLREEWLAASETALLKTWQNDADDVFNELLSK